MVNQLGACGANGVKFADWVKVKIEFSKKVWYLMFPKIKIPSRTTIKPDLMEIKRDKKIQCVVGQRRAFLNGIGWL